MLLPYFRCLTCTNIKYTIKILNSRWAQQGWGISKSFMKKISLILIASLYINNLFLQAQEIKKLSELNLQDNMMYYKTGQPFSGEVVDFYGGKTNTSKFKFRGKYINGKPVGHIKKWFPNYQLESDENYDNNGEKDGTQIYFYENAKFKERQNYKNGILNGTQTGWFKNSKKQFENIYDMGKLTGKSFTYDEEGKIVTDQEYRIGSLLNQTDYSGGKKTGTKLYTNGVPDGKWSKYDEAGNIISETEYQMGKITKDIAYKNGNISSAKYYSNGVPDGKWVDYDDNNQLTSEIVYNSGKIISQKLFKKNVPNGIWKESDGNKMKVTIYENGIVKDEGNFNKGVLDGMQLEYFDSITKKETIYKNGQKISEGAYINNKQDGRWQYWSADGQEVTVKIYEKGQLVKEEAPKNIKFLVSNFHPSENSYLLKLDDKDNSIIRVDLSIDSRPNNLYFEKVRSLIKEKFSPPSNKFSNLPIVDSNKNKSIDCAVDIYNVDVSFFNCTYFQNKVQYSGYSTTITISAQIKSVDGRIDKDETLKFTPKTLLLITCSSSQEGAFATALAEVNKKFISKLFDKISFSKRK